MAALDEIDRLWAIQRDRVEQYGVEAPLEVAFIQPVFKALGWQLIYQTHLRGRKPDYALFLSDESLERSLGVDRTSPRFWNHATALADAKAWHISLDRRTVVNQQREYPPEQLEWYLDKSLLPYGFLTNGRFWRLVPRTLLPDQPRFQTFFQCDLPHILNDWNEHRRNILAREHVLNDFLRFWLFFGPAAYREVDGRVPLIDRAREGSSEFKLGIGDDLRERTFEALRLCVQGFLDFTPNGLTAERDLNECRENSLIFLYRLLFIMYAEDRGLLPCPKNRLYTENHSLRRLRHEIAVQVDRVADGRVHDYSRDSTALWVDLKALFDLIDHGKLRYEVPPYNGGLFDSEKNLFLEGKALSDWHLARVVDQLSRGGDERRPDHGLFFVDYRDLRIQHLGGIYEGLLELRPAVVQQRVREVEKRQHGIITTKYVPCDERIPDGFRANGREYENGDVVLATDKGERRATGSYYTPDHIVDHLVAKTVGVSCQRVSEGLRKEVREAEKRAARARPDSRAEAEERVRELQSAFPERVLRLRVVDPAMGSGHFLLRACQCIAEEIATNPCTSDSEPDISGDESTLTYWKRRVVETCLYGVDSNPLAVELAKLALWLETVSTGQPLTFLDHHLRIGNSLVGGPLAALGHLPGSGALLANTFEERVHQKLPEVVTALAEIRALPSATSDQVKQKERTFERALDRLKPFKDVADVWCSAIYAAPPDQPTVEEYEELLTALPDARRVARLMRDKRLATTVQHLRTTGTTFFHWALEFPDVFLLADLRDNGGGFDAVIGNPPYDVLSERESGQELDGFRHFIQLHRAYAPTRHGKNNLYKLFICRGLELLAEGGRLGYITPMAVLGDDQAVGVRQAILTAGTFASIEAFPQKDNPSKRVFRDAKLSTAAFSVYKSSDNDAKRAPFKSRVHPENLIWEESPTLTLTRDDLRLYDPDNLTVVSCSQDDWDLAVRIKASGRVTRLGDVCESFQGEVNETTDGKKGFLDHSAEAGPLILRGANVCMYTLREASQGEAVYLKKKLYLDAKGEDTKGYHFQHRRIGFQRSAPQNTFRRIIAAPIGRDEFCFDTVSYVPEFATNLPLNVVLGVLNSKLSDWYFRLGSTNSKVNEYQFRNLPCPIFKAEATTDDARLAQAAERMVVGGDADGALRLLQDQMRTPPFGAAVRLLIGRLVDRIVELEHNRTAVSRSARSALAEQAVPLQRVIDRILYELAGLTDDEAAGLETRLEAML